MKLLRFWLFVVTLLACAWMSTVALAKTKPGKTDWDDDAEKELPPLVLHGYFRFRANLFHNYDLGYTDQQGWDRLRFTSYFTPYSERNPNQRIAGLDSNLSTATNRGADTQSFASIRFRLEPTINVTEDVRIKAQLDIFDNLVMGSTPDGFPNASGLVPIIGFTGGQVPPSDRSNALRDSIRVKRAWGEVNTPFGLLAFGRMPVHWGMGLLFNDGNCMDCDYGDTFDRVIFITKVAGHYIAPAIDFASEGITSDVAQLVDIYQRGSPSGNAIDRYLGRPFDLDQRDDVNQYSLSIIKRDSPKEIKEKLENGETIINYGLNTIFRNQAWTTENRSYSTFGLAYQGRPDTPDLFRQPLFERRGMRLWMLDPWFKLMVRKMVLEFEAAVLIGTIDSSTDGQTVDILQLGAALRFSNKFLNDALVFTFETGIATGSDGFGVGVRDRVFVAPPTGTSNPPKASNFKFDPDYQLDRILWREVVGAITNAWYLKPTIQYNVTEGFGVRFSMIYSAAVNARQWPGQATPLGLEFNFDMFYKSEEFLYASLGYAGLVPFSGLSDPATGVDATYAQSIYTRLIIRY